MGTTGKRKKLRGKSMIDALFSTTKQSVLALIFGQPGRQFFATEIIKLAGKGSGSVQRELAMLVESGLVNVEAVGKQKYYRANAKSPIFDELSAIVRKTVGVVGPLSSALRKIEKEIECAFIFGSIAKGTEKASSDLDLFVISDNVGLETLYELLAPVERRLARKINCTMYSSIEFRERSRSGNSFVEKVLDGEKLFLIGDDDVLEGLG